MSKYIVVYENGQQKQIFFRTLKENWRDDLPESYRNIEESNVRIITFNPETQTTSLDENGNIITTPKESIIPIQGRLKHDNGVRAVLMALSVFKNTQIITLTEEQQRNMETNYDFDMQKLYDEFLRKVNEVKQSKL